MEYISIDEKKLIELYGSSDNETVFKMMDLMLEQTYPKATIFLKENEGKSIASKVEFLKNFTSYFNMVGLSVVSAKIELLDDKIKNNEDYLLIEEAFSNLEKVICFSKTLIEEYQKKMKK